MENNIASPFGKLQYVGDLLSTAYPTTVLYSNESDEPVIVEWLDEVEEGDLYIVYKSSVDNLKDFINGIKSHLDLITSSIDKIFYVFYDNISSNNFKKVRLSKLDKNSLPKKTSYFNEKYSEDFEIIADHFKVELPNAQDRDDYFNVLKDFSEKNDTGLLRLHLNEGNKVGHGTADTKALGKILLGYENLYYEVALDVIRGSERDAKANSLPDDVSVIDMSSTEVLIQEAASFSIYLKSKTDATSKSQNYEFVSDEIFTKVNDAISVSTNKKYLDSSKESFSPAVFRSLVDFSEIIMDNKVVLDIEYFNSKSNTAVRNVIKPSEAHTIHNNITSLTSERIEKIEQTGQFTNLNTKTAYFVFLSKEGREFSGYVDSLIKESMTSYNFKSTYKVVISQQTIIALNSNSGQVSETLLSCIEVEA